MDVLHLNPQPDQNERPKNEPGPACGAPEIGRSLTAQSVLGVIVEYGRWPKGNGTKPMSWGVALRLR